MKRYKVTKIVFAKNFAGAMRKEKRVEPVEITLADTVTDPRELGDAVGTATIGFKYDDDDSDGGE